MGNKYLIHGATYCGDGTTSAEAASAGAAGAWNDIVVMEGTAPAYGSLAAGDTVYVRSKTSAGANIVRTAGAAVSIGSASATSASPITWIIDDGTTWSGVTGTITWETPSYTLTVVGYNRLISLTKEKLIFKNSAAGAANASGLLALSAGALVSQALIDFSTRTAAGGGGVKLTSAVLDRPTARFGRLGSSNNPCAFQFSANCLILDPDIELTYATPDAVGGVFRWVSAGVSKVIGGRVWGAGATTGQYIQVTATTGNTELIGLQYPSVCELNDPVTSVAEATISGVAVDNLVGGVAGCKGGLVDSRNDGYYPTLNAVLPNSVQTPWSWKLYPVGATLAYPLTLAMVSLFSDTAATKTITLNLQIATAFTALHKGNLFLMLCYIDSATGLPKYMSTFDPLGAALDSDTSSWSSTTYGAVGLSKKKFSLTTPTSIKQNSPITATLVCVKASSSANDIMFVCPDLVLSS